MHKKFFALFLGIAFAFSTLHAADIVITAANVIPSAKARIQWQTAGVAVTAGMVMYYDNASGTVKKTVANGAAPANSVFGIALNNAAINQPVALVVFDPALAIGGTIASGANCWASHLAAGNISATIADDITGGTYYRLLLGVGVGSNSIYFNPIPGGTVP